MTQWGINNNTNQAKVYGDDVVEGEVRLVLLRMVLDNETPTLTLWTFDPTATPTEENLGEGVSLSGFEEVSIDYLYLIDTLAIGAGYTSGDMTTSIGDFDEFAIGTEYLDVVPTPNETPNDPIPGDANKDGKVDGSDVTILAGNWQKGVDDGLTAIWDDGDFNNDGKVDGSDVTILAGNWQAGVSGEAASVPEPSTIVLLLAAIAGWFTVRRR